MERGVLFKIGIDGVFGAAAVIGLGPSSFEVYRSRTIRHTPGWTLLNGQPIAEVASYSVQNKHKRRKSKSSQNYMFILCVLIFKIGDSNDSDEVIRSGIIYCSQFLVLMLLS
jgi:hypothetical protein